MTILYKYYSYAGGKAALKSQNLGFRKPEFFNDPFELTALSNSVGGDFQGSCRVSLSRCF